jgi:hypothetical protein
MLRYFALMGLCALSQPAQSYDLLQDVPDSAYDYDDVGQVNHYDPYIWNGTTGQLTVEDNGVMVCSIGPSKPCVWRLSDGNHHLVVRATVGSTIRTLDVVTPRDAAPGSAFSDCDFQPGGCPKPW